MCSLHGTGKWKWIQMVNVIWRRWPPWPYMIKPLKIFLSGTKRSMTLKLCMRHYSFEYYQVCSNDDPGLTLAYFTARSNLVPFVLYVYACPSNSNDLECIKMGTTKPRCIRFFMGAAILFKKAYVVSKASLRCYRQADVNIDQCEGHSDSTFSNFFSSKNTRLLDAEFHMEPPWDVGMKLCSNVLGHMPKLVSRSIYMVKTSKKSSSSEPRGRWHWNLVYSIGYSSTTKVQICTGLTLTIFMTWSNLFPNASAWVKAYTAYSLICPSLFLFSISYALRGAIQEHGSSGYYTRLSAIFVIFLSHVHIYICEIKVLADIHCRIIIFLSKCIWTSNYI